MDSFFSKGAFKATKCKTMLKLTIPRIKLLRNRREIQIKQMRRDIAKLLETGQEATARIRIEHIIREEKMMAAQEIIELFSELIAVRLPIIEAQKECPLDLKEAISSICFAAPRCADLPELQQVQLQFVGKYGKEFVAAATELRPECGVNRQLIELLSIRAPSPDVKLKILKEIAEEHQLDWDPSASETELLKPHEDLLNGPAQFVSSSKVPLPEEKHEEVPSYLAPDPDSDEASDSELDFPEVPKQPIRPSTEMLPFPADALSDEQFELPEGGVHQENAASITVQKAEEKQFLPFILPPPQSVVPSDNGNRAPETIETSLPETPITSAQKSEQKQFVPSNPTSSRAQRDVNVDLQDVLAAAVAAAESAERAAAAARSAASLAQMRISELSQWRNEAEPEAESLAQMRLSELSQRRLEAELEAEPKPEPSTENPFHVEKDTWELVDKPRVDRETSPPDSNDVFRPPSPHHNDNHHVSDIPSYDDADSAYKPFMSTNNKHDDEEGATDTAAAHHVFDRLPSMDDDPYTYPSLFTGPRFDSDPGSFKEDHHTSKNVL